MKSKTILGNFLLVVICCGCTSVALRRSTVNQSKTVADFLSDQVLYNLALYKDYYETNEVNGLPSFIKLNSGMTTVAQTLSGTVGLKITTGVSETDPGITGMHATTDNWAFSPVVDPNEINRLYWLYRTEFRLISTNDLLNVFPAASSVDPQGRPLLDYFPKMEGTNVALIAGQPVFNARPHTNTYPWTLSSIPGAVVDWNTNCVTNLFGKVSTIVTNITPIKTNEWFSFDAPTGTPNAFRKGPYRGHYIWITDRDQFLKFALISLGGTNNSSTLTGGKTFEPYLLIQNGIGKQVFQ